MGKYTQDEFKKKAISIHGDRYDYSKVKYTYTGVKICIICKIHGEFWQTPGNHLNSSGCFLCSKMRRLSNKEEFIFKANMVHGNIYDYSKVIYVRCTEKVLIICKVHGKFLQTVSNHLQGAGCPKCADLSAAIKNTLHLKNNKHSSDIAKFISKANKVYGKGVYDYSKMKYKGYRTKICIVCKVHGSFLQSPNVHLSGKGCFKCAGDKNKVFAIEFINDSKKIYGENKYNYSKVNYINKNTKVCIICNIHGNFYQYPYKHLVGVGCPLCGCLSSAKCRSLATEEFIFKANGVHGEGTYDYSKVDYAKSHKRVCIICKEHGEFWQTPTSHLSGSKCFFCGHLDTAKGLSLTTAEFIIKAKEVHKDGVYDYSKVKYVNRREKIAIICKKHGEFLQKPTEHLSGCGCKKCHFSLGETLIEKWLIKKNIEYKCQHKFNNLRGLDHRNFLRFDFYVPSINLLIEFDGAQHFKPTQFRGVSKKKIYR